MTRVLLWCDRMVTILKEQGITFYNGIPVIPKESIYDGVPFMIETYNHRNEIPDTLKSCSLISYFDNDSNLLNRIEKVEDEISILKQYGGICGFDLSPCITMLRPRQKLSMLVSSLFNCYAAINGIKVLINARMGDLATMSNMSPIPKNSNIITGELGCHGHGYKYYGFYQLKMTIETVDPKILFVYGQLSKKDIRYVCGNTDREILMYPCRRRRMRDHKAPTAIRYIDGQINSYSLDEYLNDRGA